MSFECVECGYSSVKWLGKCPQCSGWDTFDDIQKYAQTSSETADILNTDIEKLSEVQSSSADRIKCHITGIDRLLGGGVVKGEVILLGGPPGVGKSTLFLQIADKLASSGKKVLFVSGEESPSQIKIHSDRLGIKGDGITVIGSGDLSITEKIVRENKPDIIFVDSIQAVIDPACSGSAGSLKQVKRSGQKLTALAKNSGAVVFVSGQITKQGDIAGPKVLEHIVDAVIYLDALDGNQRIISAVKNRFGACGDFVLFNLTDSGLVETDNLQDAESSRRKEIIGQASSCVRVGSRLVVAELQSLVAGSYFEYPLRRTSGYSRERLLMLTAIGEKYLGLKLGGVDVYLNVSGPDRVNERTSDLGVIASIYSSFKDIALSGEMMFLGEVGLSGEVRPVQDISERIKFALRNKFKQVVLSGYGKKITPDGISVSKIKYIKELREIIK